MNFRSILGLTLFFLIASIMFGYGQGSKLPVESVVKGRLMDSTHNIAMQSATVALYHAVDEKLISYQLSDKFGNFKFSKAPVGIPLRLVATFLGYSATKKDFLVIEGKSEFDLQTLNMQQSTNLLEEVNITAVPPMRLRGDTLEFNADAFKLDSNAVVEDMLRKVPGITIWSDGLITVNGKKIKKMLVEGKEFFGGDPKIALQNLPKNAVDKIQVYHDKNLTDPIDSTAIMNVKLKKDKKDGIFGKIGLGLGTRNYYDGNGSLSYFSPKNQISAALANNNVNKTANSVNQLVSLSSFKGEGLDNNYFSDFSRKGMIRFRAAGFNLSHDFNNHIDHPNQTNILDVNFINNGNRQTIEERNLSTFLIDENENFKKTSDTEEVRSEDGFSSRINYARKFDNSTLKVFNKYERNTLATIQSLRSSTINTKTAIGSESEEKNDILGADESINAGISLSSKRYVDVSKNKYKGLDMDLNYSFDWRNSDRSNVRSTNFIATDSLPDRYFLRKYQRMQTAQEHKFIANLNDIISLIGKSPMYLTVDFQNSLTFVKDSQNAIVVDRKSSYDVPNLYLTNESREMKFQYQTGIKIGKIFNNVLKNRYTKAFKIALIPTISSFSRNNTSEKDFQNIRQFYSYFTPSFSAAYLNFQNSGNRQSLALDYKTEVIFPTIDQLAPLIDSTNIYTIYHGNRNLQPQYNHNFYLKYNFDNGKATNPFLIEAAVVVNITDEFIADSLTTDAIGINNHYPVNLSGNNRTTFSALIQRSYKLGTHQIQLSIEPSISYYKLPSYLNSTYIINRGNNLNFNAQVVYGREPYWTMKLGTFYLKNNSENSNSTSFSFMSWKNFFNFSAKLYKNFFFETRFQTNTNKSSFYKTENYNLWHADIGYRFLKGANAEVKFSALDLLHQNRNFTNYFNANTITNSTLNVLQQHYMLKLSYYPRAFGLKGKVN